MVPQKEILEMVMVVTACEEESRIKKEFYEVLGELRIIEWNYWL
jgi:hypothetical protein